MSTNCSDQTCEGRLQGLQALRAFAACLVLVGHVLAEAEYYFGVSLPGDAIPWTRGVDIFFVISGFVITLSAQRLRTQPAEFLRRRLLRVVPLYYVFTTLMVAVLLLWPGATKDTALDPAQILSSYGFIPYAREDGRIAPVLSLGWTLNYEIFFYATFALCMAFARPFLAICLFFVALVMLGALIPQSSVPIIFWSNPIICEFLFGIALAHLWQRNLIKTHWLKAVLCLVLGLGLLIGLHSTALPRVITAGLPATLIVGSGTVLCPRFPVPGQLMGDASYALYLSHRFVLRAATIGLLPLLPVTATGVWIYVFIVTVTALFAGVLTHLVLERPLISLLKPTPKTVTA